MIVTDEKLLRRECKDSSLIQAPNIISKLENELNATESGIGLAANQIGIDAKICIIRVKYPDGTVHNPLNLINPVIVDKHDIMEFINEGCLSYPKQFIKTGRFNEILVRDLIHPNGIICVGVESVVVQHEVGHLYGETMYDYEIKTPGVNLKCWCGSGVKYKKCHMKGKIIQTI